MFWEETGEQVRSAGQAVYDTKAAGVGSIQTGQGQQRCRRGGPRVNGGIRGGSAGEPVQDLEPDVFRDVFSASGEGGRGTETARRDEDPGSAHCGRQNRADGGGPAAGGPHGIDFHPDSYGYRPGKSAHDALARCRQRCWEGNWVVDLDIEKFFDSLDHDLVVKAVEANTGQKWVLLYVKRWLKAPLQMPDGTLRERGRGTPQGNTA